jgi:hypothetical protein
MERAANVYQATKATQAQDVPTLTSALRLLLVHQTKPAKTRRVRSNARLARVPIPTATRVDPAVLAPTTLPALRAQLPTNTTAPRAAVPTRPVLTEAAAVDSTASAIPVFPARNHTCTAWRTRKTHSTDASFYFHFPLHHDCLAVTHRPLDGTGSSLLTDQT